MPTGSILVTDDDDYVRRAVARLLRHYGFHVVCASSGADALELAASARFSLVLLDVMMPGMDGLQVAQELRAQHGLDCPPIAIMSAGPVSDRRRETLGAIGFLRKPFTADKLLTLVTRCIASETEPATLATITPSVAAH